MKNNSECRGYGRVYRDIMCDTLIGIGEKAVYAYLCSYAGEKLYCYPPKDLICRQLGINKCTLNKYINSLRRRGYLITASARAGGRFANTRYILTPDGNGKDAAELASALPDGLAYSVSASGSADGVTAPGQAADEKTVCGKTAPNNNKYKNNIQKNKNIKNNSLKNRYIFPKAVTSVTGDGTGEETDGDIRKDTPLCGTLPFGV